MDQPPTNIRENVANFTDSSILNGPDQLAVAAMRRACRRAARRIRGRSGWLSTVARASASPGECVDDLVRSASHDIATPLGSVREGRNAGGLLRAMLETDQRASCGL